MVGSSRTHRVAGIFCAPGAWRPYADLGTRLPAAGDFHYIGNLDCDRGLPIPANADANLGAAGTHAHSSFYLRCVHSVFGCHVGKICAARATAPLAGSIPATRLHHVFRAATRISLELSHRMARQGSEARMGESLRLGALPHSAGCAVWVGPCLC